MQKKLTIQIILFLVIISLQIQGQVKENCHTDQFIPMMTGVINRDFADSTRSNWLGTGPRPMRTVIWYPAGQGGKPETIIDSSQFPTPFNVLRDAGVSGLKSKYPLILISHGSMGNAQQMRWLACYLASRGYISVVINHNGTDIEERKIGFLTLSDACMWERPRDLSAVLDKMLKDPVFAGRIDTSRIAAAGLSLGGATAIWVAGAIFSVENLAKNEPPPPEFLKSSIDSLIELSKTDPMIINSRKHSADSFLDKRIKAVFALAPAIGQGFTSEGVKDVRIPVQIVVGDQDIVAPLSNNAAHYAKILPNARPLIILPGERGHYTKPQSGTGRALELQEVSQLAFSFFEDVLK